MAEGDLHKHLKKLALYFMKEKVTDIVCNEVKMFVSRKKLIADNIGLNLQRKEIRFIEVKTSKKDFERDTLLFEDKFSYAKLGHYAYIMCPKDMLTPDELPVGYGLLYVDDYDNITVAKKPIKNPKPKLKFDTILKHSVRALTNQYLFKDQNKEEKDDTRDKYSNGALIHFVSATCPSCKFRGQYLVKADDKIVKCSKMKCKSDIDLSKARKNVITGYNKTFINKINSLSGKDET